MPKPKTKKKAVMETTCTETENGGWSWQTSEAFKWVHYLNPGLNLYQILPSGKMRPVLFAKTLDQAVMWTWGFTQGFNERGKLDVQNPTVASEESNT